MCCTVVMPEAIISNAEYSVSRYRFRLRATMRVTNHSSSGMSGEPSCTGVRPTWWWPLMKPGSRISLPVPITGTFGCLPAQVGEGADGGDRAVLLQHGAVGDFVPAWRSSACVIMARLRISDAGIGFLLMSWAPLPNPLPQGEGEAWV